MEEENLVQRRSRRSTAGNRMEAALAEIGLEDVEHDADEDDVDFINNHDEEDVFESDFQSTDNDSSEFENDHEMAVLKDEKRARRAKTTKSRRNMHISDASRVAHKDVRFSPKRKRDVLEGIQDVSSPHHPSRQSNRITTVLNSQELNVRLKDAEDRRILAIKPKKSLHDSYKSQTELIQLALDREESNTASHRNYLAEEEKKRTKATAIQRAVISGPRLRWISRAERVRAQHTHTHFPRGPAAQTWQGSPYGVYAQYAQYGQFAPPRATTTVNPNTNTVGPADPFNAANQPAYSSSLTSSPSMVLNLSKSSIGVQHGRYTESHTASMLKQSECTVTSKSKPVAASPKTDSLDANPSIAGSIEAAKNTKTPISTSSLTSFTPYATLAPPPPVTIARRPYSVASVYGQNGFPYYPYAAYYYPAPIPSERGKSLPNGDRQKQARNYVVHDIIGASNQETEIAKKALDITGSHEALESDKRKKPHKHKANISWEQHMSAIFGDHVDWNTVKVLAGKTKVSDRPSEVCPITGKPARYLDPRSNVPFANVAAYKTLSALLSHQFTWDAGLGCYSSNIHGSV